MKLKRNVAGGIDCKVAGFIQMQLKRNGEVVKDTGWFPNLILDTFFNRFAADNTLFLATSQCRAGTGTTTPSASDTVLVSQVATRNSTSSSDVVGSIDSANNRVVASKIYQYQFVQGAVVANLGEVGFEFSPGAGGVNAGQLNSRSLIKDSFGTPTTLTVTADDQLVVNYRFDLYIPLVDRVGTVVLGGVTYDYIGRVALNYNATVADLLRIPQFTAGWFLAYQSTSTFGAHGADPTNQIANAGANDLLTYLNISGGKEFEPKASVSQMNDPSGVGIKCITIPSGLNTGRLYKYQFTPIIPKTSLKILSLRFRMTCARA